MSAILEPGIYRAIIVRVSRPKRRWRGGLYVRLVFQLNPPDGPTVVKWISLRGRSMPKYRIVNSAIRRICGLLVGATTANFRSLKGRRCLVEIVHRPGAKHSVLMLPVRVGTEDGQFWVPLGHGWTEPESEAELAKLKGP